MVTVRNSIKLKQSRQNKSKVNKCITEFYYMKILANIYQMNDVNESTIVDLKTVVVIHPHYLK